jgi:DNA polymerase-1
LIFNINSPRQLGDVLFEKMRIVEGAQKTKTNQYSTGEDILVRLADKHPIINMILDYRAMQKLLNTYVDSLPGLIDPKTGKIHTSFDQAWVSTGRLSSKNPNLQNIPIRDARGKEIRKAFIPSDEDHILLSADYSQIELRLMAHLSEDEHMIEAFCNREDIHTATAAKIYKIPEAEVTSEMRSSAKTANFGIIYGISAFGLSQRLNISRSEASSLIQGYFESYPRVKAYMERAIEMAREKGYVETLLGRRRFLPDIKSANAIVRGVAQRNAINAPIQGSAADIIKQAMVNIQRKLRNGYKTAMILQVHDELIFDVARQELEDVKIIVRNEMENAISLKVPLTVDIGTGNNWLEAH